MMQHTTSREKHTKYKHCLPKREADAFRERKRERMMKIGKETERDDKREGRDSDRGMRKVAMERNGKEKKNRKRGIARKRETDKE